MISVDTTSAVPPFEQLRQQCPSLRSRTASPAAGYAQLPTVRRLAADLGLAPNTVARTYRELEQAGLVRTAGRRGTVVAERSHDVPADARRSASDFVRRMRALGLTPSETVVLVRRALET